MRLQLNPSLSFQVYSIILYFSMDLQEYSYRYSKKNPCTSTVFEMDTLGTITSEKVTSDGFLEGLTNDVGNRLFGATFNLK
jgi:hypothetical protein